MDNEKRSNTPSLDDELITGDDTAPEGIIAYDDGRLYVRLQIRASPYEVCLRHMDSGCTLRFMFPLRKTSRQLQIVAVNA